MRFLRTHSFIPWHPITAALSALSPLQEYAAAIPDADKDQLATQKNITKITLTQNFQL